MKSNIIVIVVTVAAIMLVDYLHLKNYFMDDPVITPTSLCSDNLAITFHSLSNPALTIPDVTVNISGTPAGPSDHNGVRILACCSDDLNLSFVHPDYQTVSCRITNPCDLHSIFVFLVDGGNPENTSDTNQIYGSLHYSDYFAIGGLEIVERAASGDQVTRVASNGQFHFGIQNRIESILSFGPSGGPVTINLGGLNDSTRIDVVMDHSTSGDTTSLGPGGL